MRKKQIKVEEETLPIRTFLRQIQIQTKSASQISPSHFAHDLRALSGIFTSKLSNIESNQTHRNYSITITKASNHSIALQSIILLEIAVNNF